MMRYISHISSEISEWEAELFIKAVSTKGIEETGAVWLTWWFDYKNDPKNIIREDLKARMIEAAMNNSGRIAKAVFSFSKSENFKYKLRNRPCGIGCQPDGFINHTEMDKKETGFYGELTYDRELTEAEIYKFELTPSIAIDSALPIMSQKAIILQANELKRRLNEGVELALEEIRLQEILRKVKGLGLSYNPYLLQGKSVLVTDATTEVNSMAKNSRLTNQKITLGAIISEHTQGVHFENITFEGEEWRPYYSFLFNKISIAKVGNMKAKDITINKYEIINNTLTQDSEEMNYIEFVQEVTIRIEILKPITEEQIQMVKKQKTSMDDLPNEYFNMDMADEYGRKIKKIKVIIDDVEY